MNGQSVFSGLGQDGYAAVLGEAAWPHVATRWKAPATVLAGPADAIPGDATLYWLYRSPAQALFAAPAGAPVADVLERWMSEARAVLNARRTLRDRLVLVGADALDVARFGEQAGIGVAGARSAAAADPVVPVLDDLLRRALPALGELHDLMRAASDAVADAASDPRDGVIALLESLAKARHEGAAAVLEIRTLGATNARLLNQLVEVQELVDRRAADVADLGHKLELRERDARLLRERLQVVTREMEAARTGLRAVEQAALSATAEADGERTARLAAEEAGRDASSRLAASQEEVRRLSGELEAARRAARVGGARVEAELHALRSERDRLLAGMVETQELLEQRGRDAAIARAGAADLDQALQTAQREVQSLRHQVGFMQEELLQAMQPGKSLTVVRAPLQRRVAHRLRQMIPGRAGAARAAADRAAVVGELRRSRWFDAQWYLDRYEDVAAAGIDPVEHFLDHGAAEGRDPGPRFSTSQYVEAYPDVSASGMNPLVHFLRHGLAEGRLPSRPA